MPCKSKTYHCIYKSYRGIYKLAASVRTSLQNQTFNDRKNEFKLSTLQEQARSTICGIYTTGKNKIIDLHLLLIYKNNS